MNENPLSQPTLSLSPSLVAILGVIGVPERRCRSRRAGASARARSAPLACSASPKVRLGRGSRIPDPSARRGSTCTTKVDIRLPGKGISNSHGARPVHQIVSMIKWSCFLCLYESATRSRFPDTTSFSPARSHLHRKGRYKATGRRKFRLPWRKAGPPNHRDDKVDSLVLPLRERYQVEVSGHQILQRCEIPPAQER